MSSTGSTPPAGSPLGSTRSAAASNARDRLAPLAREPQLEAAWRLLQHLYGIHCAGDDEANHALGAFIAAYQDQPLPE